MPDLFARPGNETGIRQCVISGGCETGRFPQNIFEIYCMGNNCSPDRIFNNIYIILCGQHNSALSVLFQSDIKVQKKLKKIIRLAVKIGL